MARVRMAFAGRITEVLLPDGAPLPVVEQSYSACLPRVRIYTA
jgi:hypothetical protein